MLTGLDQFLKRIEPEIESIRGNERDTASFMKMMRLFNEVTAQQQVVTIYMIYWFEIYVVRENLANFPERNIMREI